MTKFTAYILLILMGYYLLPEYYLLAFHPHEHDVIHCCDHHTKFEGDLLVPEKKICPEKENYKLVYYFAIQYFINFLAQNSLIFKQGNPCKELFVFYSSDRGRAPPSVC